MAFEGGPRRFGGQEQDELVGLVFEMGDGFGAEVVFGGDAERVGVLGDRGGEQPCRFPCLLGVGGGGDGPFVVSEDAFEDLDGAVVGEAVVVERVWLAVAGGLDVQVVGMPAAGGHRVELLAGFGAGEQAVAGVGG
ncbi:MAG TPA: hypothetical protein VGK53_23190, partial [Propionicimonas sp.]